MSVKMTILVKISLVAGHVRQTVAEETSICSLKRIKGHVP